ncbi:MAG: hypothetical protein IJ404_00795 [Clostridia bacterium]|nr:hypothetical protein [Clostridia bacterium]
MKKRLLAFFIAVTCLIMPVLTSCSEKKETTSTGTKPLTVTLYGIKGEGTTDEAIKAVQDELNVYSEGNLTTRVILKLFTEDEYYAKLDEALVAAKEYKKNNKGSLNSTGKDKNNDKVEFPKENSAQVDIFMVRGYEMFEKYNEEGHIEALNLTDKSGLMRKYISDRFLALTNMATLGNLGNKYPSGIMNNTVYGDYTYLLVNKEVADKYGYAENNLDTLPELNNLLRDAAKDFKNYVTLYNAPEVNLDDFGGTMVGTVIEDTDNAFKKKSPTSLLENEKYLEYAKYYNLFKSKGYITVGDAYALPEDKKVAAAFIKGNASIPEQYGEDYLVVPYAKPVMEDMGTIFCVSKYASESARALEIINLLQTNVEYRNTFQYGVEDVHYRVDDYTGMIDIISEDYNMNPQDTGNLFLLKENSSMDAATKALCANNWALAKQQLRDTVVAPYLLFTPDLSELDYDGFKAESDSVLNKLMAYNPGSSQTFEAYAAQLNAAFKKTDAFISFADNSAVPALADETVGDETTGDETTGDETTGDETTGDETPEPAPQEPEIPDPVFKQYELWCVKYKIV